MQEMVGPLIPFDNYSIHPYKIGDMTSTVYPVRGGLEDWGYGAGWDVNDKQATNFVCTPKSYPLEKQIDVSFAAQ